MRKPPCDEQDIVLFFIALFLVSSDMRNAPKVKLAFIALFLAASVVRYARELILVYIVSTISR